MRQPGKHVPKSVQDWESLVRQYGCVITRSTANVEIHHVYGSTYKHNKILIGPHYILPLTTYYHRAGQFNVTDHPKKFAEQYGHQRVLFETMVNQLWKLIPATIYRLLPGDVYKAILASPLR